MKLAFGGFYEFQKEFLHAKKTYQLLKQYICLEQLC